MVQDPLDSMLIEMLISSHKVDRIAFYQAALEESATPISENELRILTARLAGKRN